MQSKKFYRLTAAFISFLLMVLYVSVLPVRAEDTLAGGLETAADEETSPSEGGVEVTNGPVFDFGEKNPDEVLDSSNKVKEEVLLTNLTGKPLTLAKVSLWDSASSQYKEITPNGASYSGTAFGIYGPKNLDASGELQTMPYTLEPIRRAAVLIPREEPYEDKFQMTFQDSVGGEYTAEFTAVIKILGDASQAHITKITAINGMIRAYMNTDLISSFEALKAIKLEDFSIRVIDQDKNEVSLEGLNISYEEKENIVKLGFKDIQSDFTGIMTVEVSYKDEAVKTTTFEVFMTSTETNVPDDGNVVIHVIDDETGKPVPNAPVTLIGSGTGSVTVSTGADGYARFQNVQPGIYSVSIHMSGYEEVDMEKPKLTEELEVRLSLPGDLGPGEASEVQILVVNQYDEPVADAEVRFYCAANNGKGSAKTNTEGVAIHSLTRNNYEITVSKSGHFPSNSIVLSVTNKKETLKVTIEQRFMCSVMTTVKDEDGNPVKGALVYYTCPTDTDVGKSTTNAEGKTSEWISIRANDYVLKVSKAGYDTYTKKVRVSEKNAEFTVTLQRMRAIEDDDDDEEESSSSSSNTNASTSESVRDPAVNSKNQVIASEINRQILAEVRNQAAAGKTAVAEVKVKNAGSITPEALKSMRLTTEASKGKAKLLADSTTPDGKIAARLYIDPEKSFYVNKEIKLGVSIEQKDVQKTQATFEKHFDNKVSVVHFEHEGTFGMNIDAAVKVDLSGLNTKNLMFYSYNPATNRYSPVVSTDYFIDKNGFLHFNTSIGGDIVITDKPLAARA